MRRFLGTTVVGVLAIAVLELSAVPALAGPRASVSPAKRLVDGESVTVTWRGFRSNVYKGSLLVIECLPSYVTYGVAYGCDHISTHDYQLITDPSKMGAGSVSLHVYSGALNLLGACGLSSDTNNCVIVVATLDRHDRVVADNIVALPILFNLSRTTPVLKAAPTSGLVNGKKVHIVSEHFSAALHEVIYECDGNYQLNGVASCSSLGVPVALGDLDVWAPVIQGTIRADDHGTCGTSTDDNDCVLVVVPYDVHTNVMWSSAMFVPISFALPG